MVALIEYGGSGGHLIAWRTFGRRQHCKALAWITRTCRRFNAGLTRRAYGRLVSDQTAVSLLEKNLASGLDL